MRSERNQVIALDYIADSRDIGKELLEFTIENNTRIMMFMLKNLRTDFDKLTQADVKQFKGVLDTIGVKMGSKHQKPR